MPSQPAHLRSPQPNLTSTPAGAAKKKFRLVIVDQHPLCRKGLRELFQQDGRFKIIAEAESAKAAVRAILEHQPDVAVLDASLQGNVNLEVVTLMKARDCKTDFVILAQQPDEMLFEHAIRLGVKGYVLKRSALKEIIDCVLAVASGHSYVTPLLTALLLHGDHFGPLSQQQSALKQLTEAERRILKLVAHGNTSRKIAAECGISPRTVDSHRAHICEKLGLKGTNCLLHFALEHRDSLDNLD
jgi:DNA-binding NarL/FixJ family response regulator